MEFTKSSENKIDKVVACLPQENICGRPFVQYNGTWYALLHIPGVISSHQLFQADESDIIIASFPKCETTWLRALIFSIVNCNRYQPKESPLLSIHPQILVPSIEMDHFHDGEPQNIDQLSRPRISSTHIPYAFLPNSIITSNSRVVYVCSNPLDALVSCWHFLNSIMKQNNTSVQLEPIDEFFDQYCRGYGPFWDNILGYWKVSVEKPESVLFMMYEDLKEDSMFQLKRLASLNGKWSTK